MFIMKVDQNLSIVFLHQNYKKQFFELFKSNKLQLSRWFNWPVSCQCEDDFLQLIQHSLFEYARGTSLQCGISYQGDFIGYIGLTKINPMLAKAELSYWISNEYQGRGIMNAVWRQMIRYAFVFLNLEKIEISIATENIGSRKVCESLNFELEGILKRADTLNGKVVDHARYGLLRNTRVKV